MIINCPACGARSVDEFVCRGDAGLTRPSSVEPTAMDDWHAYVYLRDNPKGRLDEYWHHAGGCRSWLVVTRDTETHDIHSVAFACDVAGGRST